MNSLFGIELPATVTAIIAFVVVIALIGATAWLVRRFGASRLGAGRGRQPRLAVIDAAAVDGRRKLVIIRRDNVEHLLMIGGPTDVVVETNILRAASTQRDAAPVRADTLPRAVPLSEAVNWPPQLEPALAPRVDRPRAPPEESAPAAQPIAAPLPPPIPAPLRSALEPLPRVLQPPPADPLIGLAAELSRARQDVPARPPDPPRLPMTASYASTEAPITPGASVTPANASADAQLAEMAQRLESALRRPLGAGSQNARPDSALRPSLEPKRMESKAVPHAEQAPSGPNGGPANGMQGNGATAQSIYEDLEQEMASLLGRQPGKT